MIQLKKILIFVKKLNMLIPRYKKIFYIKLAKTLKIKKNIKLHLCNSLAAIMILIFCLVKLKLSFSLFFAILINFIARLHIINQNSLTENTLIFKKKKTYLFLIAAVKLTVLTNIEFFDVSIGLLVVFLLQNFYCEYLLLSFNARLKK